LLEVGPPEWEAVIRARSPVVAKSVPQRSSSHRTTGKTTGIKTLEKGLAKYYRYFLLRDDYGLPQAASRERPRSRSAGRSRKA
jgi:hypothetical protein